MTEIEAIEVIEHNVFCNTDNYEMTISKECYKTIINALEKQVPKKPKKSQSKLRYLGTYMCPSCGGDFSGTGVASYCYHCGQRFKWNDAEDWSDGE